MKPLRTIIQLMVSALTLASLSSCSLLSPVDLSSQSTYLLNTLPQPTSSKRSHPITLLVMPVESRPIYNTTQMAYSTKPHQIAYFSQNQWGETPSQMWLPLMVQSLQRTHYFRAVVTPPFSAHYDYVLNTQMVQLKQDFTCQPAVVQLTLRVQITRASTNQLIATRQFSVQQPMTQRTPYAGVLAANEAAAAILKEINSFCIKYTSYRG